VAPTTFNRTVVRARDLVAMLLCLAPPLFLSNRLPTLHTVTDNKWLVVILLSACEIVLVVAAATMGPNKSRRTESYLSLVLIVAAAVLAMAHLCSALFCREPGFSLRGAIPPLSLIALFAAMVWRPASSDAIRKFTAFTIGTGALVGACAIAQHLGFDPLAGWVRYRAPQTYRTSVYVTLGNPEYLGGYLAPLALAAVGVAAASAGWRARGAALVAATLTAAPAILSGSRGAFLGMATGAVVLLIGALVAAPHLSRRKRAGWLLAAGAAAALIVVALFTSPRAGPIGLLRSRLAQAANPYSDSIRVRIMFNMVGLDMLARHPVFGVGPGMFGVEFYPALLDLERRDPGAAMDVLARDLNGVVAEHAHNDWLEIWAETGTIGFSAWLMIVVAWAAIMIRAVTRRSAEIRDLLFALALAAAVVALLVNASFNFPLHEPARATLFWLALAWSVSLVVHRGTIDG
jgi:O-antigen ligase